MPSKLGMSQDDEFLGGSLTLYEIGRQLGLGSYSRAIILLQSHTEKC